MHPDQKPVYYSDYLKLDSILSAQIPESPKYGKMAHDEMLFIIIHQSYELWFKQVLFELDSITEIFKENYLPSHRMQTVVARFERVTEILKLLVDQVRIIETMTPLDFMDFRDYLVPASGFQSLQFKMLEAKLGIKTLNRTEMEKNFFKSRMKPEDFSKLEAEEKQPSLFELVDHWLARMPFTKKGKFNFWNDYEAAVKAMLDHDEEIILNNATIDEQRKKMELKNLEMNRISFKSILDSKLFEEAKAAGSVKMSQEAIQSAIFIHLFRDMPMLQLPYKILSLITDIDEHLTAWRQRHAIMVHRLIGTKIGTGGSSGHDYLKKTTESNRVFVDLFNLATFLLPKSKIPKLPMSIVKTLDFEYDHAKG
jgi:tryptophan 2,3-dioxygenase